MTRRIIRNKPKPKRAVNHYVCPACQGVIKTPPRCSLERTKGIHEASCPTTLRLQKKGR